MCHCLDNNTSICNWLDINVSLSLPNVLLTWHKCDTLLTSVCHFLDINFSLSLHQCVTVFTSICHWLKVNVTFSTSFFWFCLMSSKNVNLRFIYWYLRCTVHGFCSFCRCISIYLKCTWTLLPLPLWACQPVKELFRNPTWMLLWDLWRNMLQKSTLARYVF